MPSCALVILICHIISYCDWYNYVLLRCPRWPWTRRRHQGNSMSPWKRLPLLFRSRCPLQRSFASRGLRWGGCSRGGRSRRGCVAEICLANLICRWSSSHLSNTPCSARLSMCPDLGAPKVRSSQMRAWIFVTSRPSAAPGSPYSHTSNQCFPPPRMIFPPGLLTPPLDGAAAVSRSFMERSLRQVG
jgi:hypothetical protein